MTWSLTQPALDRLLALLDRDRARAADKYEAIRQRLMKFFAWRGCADPQSYADEVFDRVARRLGEGVSVRAADPYVFFHGIALNLVKEDWRASHRAHAPIGGRAPGSEPVDDPREREARDHDRDRHEQRLQCLERCVSLLPPESRTLVARYYLPDAATPLAARRDLAAAMGIPLNALRIRVFRLRQTIERCVVKCSERFGTTSESSESDDGR